MKRLPRSISLICVLVYMAAAPAFAEKKFDITYRQDNLGADDAIASGFLFVYVLNASGEFAKDVAVWIPGPNNVTYDNRVIHVGDLADGQPMGVLNDFKVPKEIAHPEECEDQITWKVEYTNSAGERVATDVVGERIR